VHVKKLGDGVPEAHSGGQFNFLVIAQVRKVTNNFHHSLPDLQILIQQLQYDILPLLTRGI